MTDQYAPDPFTVIAGYLGVSRGQVMNMTREQIAQVRDRAATESAALVRRGEMHTVPGGDQR